MAQKLALSVQLKKLPYLIESEGFAASGFHSFPEGVHFLKSHVIHGVFLGIEKNEKGSSALLLEISHKFHLVVMDILERKRIRCALLRIKTYRNTLHRAYIVHRGFPVKKEGFPPGSASVRWNGKAETGAELLKNRRGNCPYGAFLRLGGRFRAAKTEFLC